jgi:hypothetical protein
LNIVVTRGSREDVLPIQADALGSSQKRIIFMATASKPSGTSSFLCLCFMEYLNFDFHSSVLGATLFSLIVGNGPGLTEALTADPAPIDSLLDDVISNRADAKAK